MPLLFFFRSDDVFFFSVPTALFASFLAGEFSPITGPLEFSLVEFLLEVRSVLFRMLPPEVAPF